MTRATRKTNTEAAPPGGAMLPPRDTRRWVPQRKAEVVQAVQSGLLSVDEALARYRLTLEELAAWQRALYRHGLRGLQIGQLQMGKPADPSRRSAGARHSKSASS